ncbi:MAG: signal peptidase II [Longimicrobiales bacterium]
MKQKTLLATTLIMVVLALDVVTKRWALDVLAHGTTVEAAGVPLTLAFNTGIAFGLDVPSVGRWILVGASVFVVFMLAGLFHQARPTDFLRLSAVSLVTAGALGNLIDRVRWERGVVDFIGPIDLGVFHWPIFNVADMAITVGAVMLGLSLWREDAEPQTVPVLETENVERSGQGG